MKKLASICAVALIVTSAFAFTSKKFARNYCAATVKNAPCTLLISQKAGIDLYFIDPNIFPVNSASCNQGVCDTRITLSMQD